MIRVLAILLTLPTAIVADVLAEFEQRCLLPMERIALHHPDDLPIDETFQDLKPGMTAYALSALNGHIVIGEDPVSCMLHGIELDERVSTWLDAMIADDRYVLPSARFAHGPTVLQSTEWREPKIEVIIHWFTYGEQQFIQTIETDLES